jgi:hypothetical protein
MKSKLYDMPKQRKQKNWICIKLICPEKMTKKVKTKYLAIDVIGAYCTQCEQCNPFSVSNPSNVIRHMDSVHSDLIQHYQEVEERNKIKGRFGLSAITHQFPNKAKQEEKRASVSDQKYLLLLSTLWTCSSLRPVMVTWDEYLQEVISLSLSVNGALKLPSCNLNRKNIMTVHMWMKQC